MVLNTLQVYNEVFTSLKNKTPLSLIRLGDGESMCLAQNKTF